MDLNLRKGHLNSFTGVLVQKNNLSAAGGKGRFPLQVSRKVTGMKHRAINSGAVLPTKNNYSK